jgi:hypothetical protein
VLGALVVSVLRSTRPRHTATLEISFVNIRARPGEARAWLDTHLANFDANGYTDICVLWPFAVNSKGYPCIGIDGRSRLVTRLIVEHVIATTLDVDDLVCHTCDTPRCVNPAHFFRGDTAANAADMRAKGRGTIGERNPKARLSEVDVRAIRSTWTGRYGEIVNLARQYGVGVRTIDSVLHRRSWKSVA